MNRIECFGLSGVGKTTFVKSLTANSSVFFDGQDLVLPGLFDWLDDIDLEDIGRFASSMVKLSHITQRMPWKSERLALKLALNCSGFNSFILASNMNAIVTLKPILNAKHVRSANIVGPYIGFLNALVKISCADRIETNRIVIFDEGPIKYLQSLFAPFLNHPDFEKTIERLFAELPPICSAVFLETQNYSALIERLDARHGGRPQNLKGKTNNEVIEVFEREAAILTKIKACLNQYKVSFIELDAEDTQISNVSAATKFLDLQAE